MKRLTLLTVILFASIGASATNCEHWTSIRLDAGNSHIQQVVTGVAAKQTRLCTITLFNTNGASGTVQLIEGTGGNCAAGTSGMIGGTGSGTGMVFPTNTNFLALGQATNGLVGVVTSTTTAADDVCLASPSGIDTSGVISWTQL